MTDDPEFRRLRQFATEPDETSPSIVVVNSSEPPPLMRLLDDAFEQQDVTVELEETEADVADQVVLVEDGRTVATSPLEELMNSYLLINSDLYRTGTSGGDKYEAPDVLTGLADHSFRVRGFPRSNKEKLLLVLISRYIERLALDADDGTLRTSFQRLSRLNDEVGTRAVYDRLADSGVETHIYGYLDTDDLPADLTVHAGAGPVYEDSWFVVFDPAAAAVDPAALVALVDADAGVNEWVGRWTFDPDRVDEIAEVVEQL
jgi:hypothetical protein